MHFYSKEFSSFLPVKSAFFLKSRLLFNALYCCCMFVHFTSFRANNCIIPLIKNAKLSGYYFHMNWNIYRDFQICISVSLIYPVSLNCVWSARLFHNQKQPPSSLRSLIIHSRTSAVIKNFLRTSFLKVICEQLLLNNHFKMELCLEKGYFT